MTTNELNEMFIHIEKMSAETARMVERHAAAKDKKEGEAVGVFITASKISKRKVRDFILDSGKLK